MKIFSILTFAALLIGAASFLTPDVACAQGNCGYKPIKPYVPIGCKDIVATCGCDSQGKNCRWSWICVK